MLQFYEKNFERGDKLGLKASNFQRKEKSMYSIRKLIRTESLMFNFFFINFVHWELFHKVEKVNNLCVVNILIKVLPILKMIF